MKNLQVKDIGSGLKGINFEYWGGLQGFLDATSTSGNATTTQSLRRVIPWVAKATSMTANAVADLPFEIMKEGEVFDSSTDWQNKIGGIPSPEKLLYLLASSLCLGQAYAIVDFLSQSIVSVQYCAPQTVTPKIGATAVESFDRTTSKGATGKYYPTSIDGATDYMLYFWLPDSDIELGPAMTYPAGTALLSASLLFGMDKTIQTYADRNFIPPTVLAAKGMPTPEEIQRAEHWWDRFFRGKTDQIAKILNAEALSVVKVGAGIEDFKGAYGDLVKQAVENIGTSYGIPAALFMSDMAFASEVNPMTKVWYTTSQFKTIYQTIESTFNEQILNRYGLRWKFRPETLDAFKDDQLNNAQAYSTYVTSGIKPSLAAQMAGLKLPDGVAYEDLDPEPEPEPVVDVDPKQNEEQEGEPVEPLNAKQIKELNLWRQISERCFRNSKGVASDFECKDITEKLASEIRTKLAHAKTKEDIVSAFEISAAKSKQNDDSIRELARAINHAAYVQLQTKE